MAGNTFGQAFTLTTFGESHGPALGAVVDGCPPGLALEAADLQRDLDRRRPGQSKYTTQRREPDAVRILSGVFEGVTTGTSMASPSTTWISAHGTTAGGASSRWRLRGIRCPTVRLSQLTGPEWAPSRKAGSELTTRRATFSVRTC